MKKFLSFIFTIILCVSIVGCGNKELNKADGAVKPSKNISESVHKATKKDVSEEDKISDNHLNLEETPASEDITIAMYVPINDWKLFISETGPFSLIGENIEYLDVEGNSITENNLVAGNIVEITSAGIMLESYPGQLAGVTKVKITEIGSPEDVSQYQEIIDELTTPEPDITEIPTMNVNYKTELADTTMLVEHNGGYQWNTEVESSISPYENLEVVPIANIGEKTDISLYFSIDATSVIVNKYENETSEPVEIPVTMENDSYVIKDATPALYCVYAEFAYGNIEYRFISENK